MIKYPKQEYAKTCYQEYENNLIFSFTGSRGADVPEAFMKELRDFKQAIFGKE